MHYWEGARAQTLEQNLRTLSSIPVAYLFSWPPGRCSSFSCLSLFTLYKREEQDDNGHSTCLTGSYKVSQCVGSKEYLVKDRSTWHAIIKESYISYLVYTDSTERFAQESVLRTILFNLNDNPWIKRQFYRQRNLSFRWIKESKGVYLGLISKPGLLPGLKNNKTPFTHSLKSKHVFFHLLKMFKFFKKQHSVWPPKNQTGL